MNAHPLPQPPGLNLADIYYILFRHKWKILLCSITGIAAAIFLYKAEAPPFQSEAKLLVRYIISESKATGPTNNATSKILADERGATIMVTETEILNSVDLARAVAATIGPERLLATSGGGNDMGKAIELVKTNLRVFVPQSSNVIHIIFQHPDYELVRPVLEQVVEQYLKLHVEAHRAVGMLGDSLAAEADTLRARLAQTEDELRRASSRAGVINLESTKEAYSNHMTAIRREILNYEAELAGRLAVFEDIKKRTPATSPVENADNERKVPQAVIDEYNTALTRFKMLQNMEQELLLQFTPDTPRVKEVQALRTKAENSLKTIREANPRLFIASGTEMASGGGAEMEANEAANSWLQITSYQAKIKELTSQYDRIRADAAKLDQMEGTILELRRKKELEEATYRYYANNLEQSRISQTLGNGKVSNISRIQAPSPPYRDAVNVQKLGLIAVGGILTGLAWAFLIELYFDRSVRRPADLQRMLRVPLFLSIPLLKSNGRQLALEAPKSSSDAKTAAHSSSSALAAVSQSLQHQNGDKFRPFHETLRDRLMGYFENKNLTHKPKLVAVTGLSNDAGVTTTAAGLARSLSETGEGNVLLVDMTLSQGAAQQFAKGAAVCGLDDLLEARSQAHVHENLYVVSETSNSDRLSRNLPQRFTKLIPKLKASDFDYIIFDMPPVSQLSITPRLAGFMDMVLLVVESEKNDREVVQGACSLLADSKAHVGVVLNKLKSYVPRRLQQEMMSG